MLLDGGSPQLLPARVAHLLSFSLLVDATCLRLMIGLTYHATKLPPPGYLHCQAQRLFLAMRSLSVPNRNQRAHGVIGLTKNPTRLGHIRDRVKNRPEEARITPWPITRALEQTT